LTGSSLTLCLADATHQLPPPRNPAPGGLRPWRSVRRVLTLLVWA
jgi:hypothetical protein